MDNEVLVDQAVDVIKQLRRENAKLKRQYKKHVVWVAQFIAALDEAMKGPSTPERGRKIAELSNKLQMGNDHAWHFDLGYDLKKKRK